MMFAHNSEEVIENDEYGKAVFDAEVIYPEVDNLFTLKPSTLNMCTQSVQLKVAVVGVGWRILVIITRMRSSARLLKIRKFLSLNFEDVRRGVPRF